MPQLLRDSKDLKLYLSVFSPENTKHLASTTQYSKKLHSTLHAENHLHLFEHAKYSFYLMLPTSWSERDLAIQAGQWPPQHGAQSHRSQVGAQHVCWQQPGPQTCVQPSRPGTAAEVVAELVLTARAPALQAAARALSCVPEKPWGNSIIIWQPVIKWL